MQTQFVLSRMDELEKKEDERWDHVMESLDLLFAKVEELAASQLKSETKFDLTT